MVIVLAACLLGVDQIIALFGGGLLGLILYFAKNSRKSANGFFPVLLAGTFQVGTLKVFLTFLKVGAILSGGGYVLFAFLDAELVSTGLLTRQELIDAIVVGQFTPGQVLSTATFIGYQLNGIWGALAATIGIFLPSFIFVAILNPLMPKFRKSKVVSAFLDAVNISAVALIAAVCIEIGKDTLTDWKTLVIAITSLVVVFYFKKLNSAFVVIGGALLGFVLTLI